ncbi:MAG TPA: CDF family Co(II)/Ni(II) efflux transporter DmeF [Xanthobacteraceae bacterium]|jgi:cation diffusion facilitator family transporter|nr:CDF family Co(II)/Ni(II) efflux transporter DmeF [Xanthobacteraceae bacterium]
MTEATPSARSHIFLGEGHERNECRTWMVIALCSAMMVAEIAGGLLFGSIALVADGLHMSTHASALLLAALAYRYARHHVHDERFTFGTGKLGDLAGFTSAIVLAMIAILIGYEAVMRLFWPVAIHFREAIPIAVLGLGVNVVSVLLLGGGDHSHPHPHGHDHAESDHDHAHHHAHRDNNMRAAVVHVLADAAVSVLVIAGLTLALLFRWRWMDPAVGFIGAVVIAAWAYTLIRDTGAILLDMNPDRAMTERMRAVIETDGDRLADFHVWRVGPGHLAAILSVETCQQRGPHYYQSRLQRFRSLSHITVEVLHQ